MARRLLALNDELGRSLRAGQQFGPPKRSAGRRWADAALEAVAMRVAMGAGAVVAAAGVMLVMSVHRATRADSAAAPVSSLPPREGGAVHHYVGNRKCKMCHIKQYRSWKRTAKGRSWRALEAGGGQEARAGAGLDPLKDYTADGRCLGCHAVGHGEPGGYAVPAPGDRRAARLAADREGAGCESCHGPGSGYTEVMRDISKAKRAYSPDELYAAGLRRIEVADCDRCHRPDAVCAAPGGERRALTGSAEADSGLWDALVRSGAHEHFPPQSQRVGTTADGVGGEDGSAAQTENN